MRTIIMVLFFLPIAATAQKQSIFLKLNDAAGKQINGDVNIKGYERWVNVNTFSNSGKNNITLNFSMAINGVSADLKRMMANGELLSGQLNLTQVEPYSGNQIPLYTIKMEGIRINACSESVGCNNTMGSNVVITATRIGWTYYQYNSKGTQTVSRKYGYDANTGQEWTNF